MRAWKASGGCALCSRLRHCGLARRSERRGAAAIQTLRGDEEQEAAGVPISALLLDLVSQSEERADRGHRCRPRQGAWPRTRCPTRDRRFGFATFIADLQANKCEIGMFGVGATLKRAQAVEFSKPYLDYQHLRGDAQGRKDQGLGRHRQEGREGCGHARQLHRALHEGLPEECGDGRGSAAEHTRSRARGQPCRRHHDGLSRRPSR